MKKLTSQYETEIENMLQIYSVNKNLDCSDFALLVKNLINIHLDYVNKTLEEIIKK